MVCERLQLRALTLEEMKKIQETDQCIVKPSVLSAVIQTAIAKKTERMQAVPEDVHPWLTYWLIQEAERGQGIGIIGSKFLPDEKGYVELGYAMAEEARGKGYMTEALTGFLDWLYAFPFCNGARLSISKDNTASLRVAEKCGFYCRDIKGDDKIYQYDF